MPTKSTKPTKPAPAVSTSKARKARKDETATLAPTVETPPVAVIRASKRTSKKVKDTPALEAHPSAPEPVVESPAAEAPAKPRRGRKPKAAPEAPVAEEVTASEGAAEGSDDMDWLADSTGSDFTEEEEARYLRGENGRKPVIPPAVVTEGMTMLDYLQQCTPPLDKKIIDIACSRAHVMGELRRDAAQEIRAGWAMAKPDTARFKPGQIASYATSMARNACLLIRRELGSAVRLPGSAFRQRRDGSSYVTPGVLAQALDWNSIESWLLLEGGEGDALSASLSLEVAGVVSNLEESGDLTTGEDEDAATLTARLASLEKRKDYLTSRQYQILKLLIEGSNLKEIMDEMGIKRGILLREVNIAADLFGEKFLKSI